MFMAKEAQLKIDTWGNDSVFSMGRNKTGLSAFLNTVRTQKRNCDEKKFGNKRYESQFTGVEKKTMQTLAARV